MYGGFMKKASIIFCFLFCVTQFLEASDIVPFEDQCNVKGGMYSNGLCFCGVPQNLIFWKPEGVKINPYFQTCKRTFKKQNAYERFLLKLDKKLPSFSKSKEIQRIIRKIFSQISSSENFKQFNIWLLKIQEQEVSAENFKWALDIISRKIESVSSTWFRLRVFWFFSELDLKCLTPNLKKLYSLSFQRNEWERSVSSLIGFQSFDTSSDEKLEIAQWLFEKVKKPTLYIKCLNLLYDKNMYSGLGKEAFRKVLLFWNETMPAIDIFSIYRLHEDLINKGLWPDFFRVVSSLNVKYSSFYEIEKALDCYFAYSFTLEDTYFISLLEKLLKKCEYEVGFSYHGLSGFMELYPYLSSHSLLDDKSLAIIKKVVEDAIEADMSLGTKGVSFSELFKTDVSVFNEKFFEIYKLLSEGEESKTSLLFDLMWSFKSLNFLTENLYDFTYEIIKKAKTHTERMTALEALFKLNDPKRIEDISNSLSQFKEIISSFNPYVSLYMIKFLPKDLFRKDFFEEFQLLCKASQLKEKFMVSGGGVLTYRRGSYTRIDSTYWSKQGEEFTARGFYEAIDDKQGSQDLELSLTNYLSEANKNIFVLKELIKQKSF